METPLHLSDAQQLWDATNDPLLRHSLEAFIEEQKRTYLDQLLTAVRRRKTVSDSWKESELAGRVAAYDSLLSELDAFAKEQLTEAKQ